MIMLIIIIGRISLGFKIWSYLMVLPGSSSDRWQPQTEVRVHIAAVRKRDEWSILCHGEHNQKEVKMAANAVIPDMKSSDSEDTLAGLDESEIAFGGISMLLNNGFEEARVLFEKYKYVL